MKILNGLSLGPSGKAWLAHSHQPHILHVFEHACNLINESGEILSIVTPQIGNGPFNLVLADTLRFTDHLEVESAIAVQETQLRVGSLTINTIRAKCWDPRPPWEMLYANRDEIINSLIQSQVSQFSNSPILNLSCAIANADLSTAKTVATQFAGLGIGLTPSSDDYILGALYAAWIIHPPAIAQSLAREIANTAAPLTTSLSGAWLRAAARGDAGNLWHDFFKALTSSDDDRIHDSVKRIQSIGATSGSDALAGFFNTLISYAEAACLS